MKRKTKQQGSASDTGRRAAKFNSVRVDLMLSVQKPAFQFHPKLPSEVFGIIVKILDGREGLSFKLTGVFATKERSYSHARANRWIRSV